MAFVNLPPNLQDIFYSITDRVAKLETGPNQAMYTAEAAQGSAQSATEIAISAQSVATQAQVQAINATVAANQAASQATIAQSQATIASSQATAAQVTANGKNKVYYSTSGPGSTANTLGDIWYQYGTSGTYANKVIAQYSGAGGTSWTSVTVSGLVIANIDAGAITTGTLSAIEINAGSGGTAFHVSPSGYMSAQGVYVKGNITADSGTFNGSIYANTGAFGTLSGSTLVNGWSIGATGLTGVGTATITGGLIQGSSITVPNSGAWKFAVDSAGSLQAVNANITGAITATGGTIGGFTIGSNYLYSGTVSIYSTGDISSNGTLYFNYISVSSATLGSYKLAVQGDSGFYGTVASTGNMTAQAYLYNPGYPSTTGSANMRINTSSGLIAYTSSSARYKVAIEEQAIPVNSIFSLTPKSYVDKTESEEKGTIDGLQRWIGLIAEDVAQIPVLKDYLVEYNAEGEPNSVYYDRVGVALIPAIQDLNNRILKLEGK